MLPGLSCWHSIFLKKVCLSGSSRSPRISDTMLGLEASHKHMGLKVPKSPWCILAVKLGCHGWIMISAPCLKSADNTSNQHFVSLTHDMTTAYQCVQSHGFHLIHTCQLWQLQTVCTWKTHECTSHWLDYLILFMFLTGDFSRLLPSLIFSSLPLVLIH